jgi:hypothetical protein
MIKKNTGQSFEEHAHPDVESMSVFYSVIFLTFVFVEL